MLPTVRLRFCHQVFGIDVDVIEAAVVSPGKNLFEYREQAIRFKFLQKVHFVFFLRDAHFVEDFIMLGNAEFMKIVHHQYVLADVSAFQPPSEIEGHEPADQIAAEGNDFSNQLKFYLVVS